MKLSKAEFKAPPRPPMRRLDLDAEPPIDFWPYFESIAPEDFEGRDCGDEVTITYVWEHPDGLYQHVLVNTDDASVFMALVLDIQANAVLGHHLLDLHREAREHKPEA